MTLSPRSPEQVVILAPTGSDAGNITALLLKAGLAATSCATTAEAAREVEAGAGALLVTEEALSHGQHTVLAAAFERQPAWSDIPIVVVTSGASIHRWAVSSVELLGPRSNVSLLQRPLKGAILVAAVKNVLRARRRQYEIRDLLREREELLGSLEARVQDRTAKLQELVAELESFSYSVSHDLRAPLRVIASYAQLVLEDFDKTLVPEVRNYVQRIARSAERMDQLTQDVLAYTRLARGEISLAPTDLNTIVEETIEQYPKLSGARSAIILRRPLATVVAHVPSLIQVLSNLLGNALKFAQPGIPPRVEIFTRVRGGRVRVVVKDNGIGIDPAYHAKIFRIFERVADRGVPGTGIGLAIVKKAAERMGGQVGVKSRVGHGAEFWVELAKAPKFSPHDRATWNTCAGPTAVPNSS